MSRQFEFAHSARCPKCGAIPGRWCRERGKAVAPHSERAKEALRICSRVLQALSADDQVLLKDLGSEPIPLKGGVCPRLEN